MIIAHAIIVSGGLAALLIAAAGFVIAALVVLVRRMIQHRRHIDEPQVVPVWWDEAPAPSLSAASDQNGI